MSEPANGRMLDVAGMLRVSVVGTSCSGKTTFARALSAALKTPHVELDALFWQPEWVSRPVAEFRGLVDAAISQDAWIIDGNYSSARDLVWRRATHVIWLNYSFPVVAARAVSRTARRIVTGEELFSGNRESLRQALSHQSILLWVLATFRRNRRKYAVLRHDPAWRHIHFTEFRTLRDAAEFLSGARVASMAASGGIGRRRPAAGRRRAN